MELLEFRRKFEAKRFVNVGHGSINGNLLVTMLEILQRLLGRCHQSLRRGAPGREQLVGNIGERAGYDDRLVSETMLHDANRATDRGRIG
jgi:hypothetical protein